MGTAEAASTSLKGQGAKEAPSRALQARSPVPCPPATGLLTDRKCALEERAPPWMGDPPGPEQQPWGQEQPSRGTCRGSQLGWQSRTPGRPHLQPLFWRQCWAGQPAQVRGIGWDHLTVGRVSVRPEARLPWERREGRRLQACPREKQLAWGDLTLRRSSLVLHLK